MHDRSLGWTCLVVAALLLWPACSSGDGSSPGDEDGDGYAAAEDCDDGNPDIYPGASEVAYDGVDQDCDGSDLVDVDADGSVATEAGGNDCNDNDPEIGPWVDEVPYDGVDQDCDGQDLTDADGDGYVGEEAGGDDCADDDPFAYPGAVEIPYDKTDQDCDGEDLTDVDGDGYDARRSGGEDCNDRDETINPAAEEVCEDANVDHDCDGSTAINEEQCFLYPSDGTWKSPSGDIEFEVRFTGTWMDMKEAYFGTCTNSSTGCTATASLQETITIEIFNSYGQASFYLSTPQGDDCWGTFDTVDSARGTCSSYSTPCACGMNYEWSATLIQ